jgi:protein SCO1/2
MIRLFWILSLAGLISLTACDRGHETKSRASGPGTNQQSFQVKGVIKELKADGKTVEIRHEEVPNYMPAMTMPFEAKEPNELTGLKAGDAVSFRMTVTDTDVWIDQIRKLMPPKPNELPSRSTLRFVRDVEPLQVGDPLPEYHFTNELGEAVSTSQFKGQALAVTFIFTRCPLPNFCPLMSNNFQDAQKKLLAMPNGPTNWHLLTISFDPDFDTPVILKAYAERYGADPPHWNFLTGDLIDITAISEQFGQMFWREEGALSHNLRTVVVDAAGRVQKIFEGNKWTSDELVAEMLKGAGKLSR